MRVWFFFVLFVVTYFSSRGVLLAEFGFKGAIDFLILLLIRGVAFGYLIYSIFRWKLHRAIKKLVVVLLAISLLSFLLNSGSLQQFYTFLLLVFYPIGFALIIIEKVRYKDIYVVLIFTGVLALVQFAYSVISNASLLFSQVVVDDPFNGFFGYPRAYAFSYYSISVAAMLFVCKDVLVKTTRYPMLLVGMVLCLTPVLAGAGRVVFLLVASLPFLIFLEATSIKRNLLLVLIFFVLAFGFQKYANVYDVTGDIFLELFLNPLANLKAYYFIESFLPFIVEPGNFILGLGPGNYMSSSAQQFRLDLVAQFNDDLHLSYTTDAYQAFNNIIGFIGDAGLVFFLIYYYLAMRIYMPILSSLGSRERLVVKLFLVFTVLLSGFFHVFDDPYFSISFWLAAGVFYRLSLEYDFSAKNGRAK